MAHRAFICPWLLCVVALISPAASQGQSRPPVAEGLEAVVLHPPAIARVAGASVLVWELHLTNTRADTLRVGRVVAGEPGHADVAIFGDSSLARWMQPVARGPSRTPTTEIAPGVRRVLYAWVELPAGRRTPTALTHTVTVTTSTSEFVVTTPRVAVAAAEPVRIAPPLRGGPWAAIYDPALPGGHRMAIYTVNGQARIPARFAIDLVKLPPTGVFDRTSRAVDRNGFGSDVLAVGDGVIVDARDDMRDNDDAAMTARPRFPIEAGSGNYVTIDLGGGRFAFYEHLASKSLRVRVGQRVRTGQVIAQLGYSGSSSIGPHLHFHVANARSVLGSEGVPFALQGFEPRGAFADINAFVAGVRYIDAAGPHQQGMPRPNAVVMFP